MGVLSVRRLDPLSGLHAALLCLEEFQKDGRTIFITEMSVKGS